MNIDHYECYIATGYRVSAVYFKCLFVIRLLKISHFSVFFYTFFCICLYLFGVGLNVCAIWCMRVALIPTNAGSYLDFNKTHKYQQTRFFRMIRYSHYAVLNGFNQRLHGTMTLCRSEWRNANCTNFGILMAFISWCIWTLNFMLKKGNEIDHSRFLPFIRSFPFWFSFFRINLHGRPVLDNSLSCCCDL